jgi:hypothetical protein
MDLAGMAGGSLGYFAYMIVYIHRLKKISPSVRQYRNLAHSLNRLNLSSEILS